MSVNVISMMSVLAGRAAKKAANLMYFRDLRGFVSLRFTASP
jgi:hypothetical protein